MPAGKDVSIVWMTANISYVLDAKPDSVDYVGRKVDKLGVVLATSKTDAAGAFRVSLKAPRDFGGIHDIYAVVAACASFMCLKTTRPIKFSRHFFKLARR